MPKSFKEASKDKKWIEVMGQEIKEFKDNNTWKTVDLLEGKRTIRSKWV